MWVGYKCGLVSKKENKFKRTPKNFAHLTLLPRNVNKMNDDSLLLAKKQAQNVVIFGNLRWRSILSIFNDWSDIKFGYFEIEQFFLDGVFWLDQCEPFPFSSSIMVYHTFFFLLVCRWKLGKKYCYNLLSPLADAFCNRCLVLVGWKNDCVTHKDWVANVINAVQ